MANSKRSISASEIGSFLFCQRSWAYQRQGIDSANIKELEQGTSFHQDHGHQLQRASRLRILAFALLMIALIALLFQMLL